MARYPYGPAALVILLIIVFVGPWIFYQESQARKEKADLIFAIFSKDHKDAYTPAIAEFEKENNVHVQLQLVGARALNQRLQAALQVDADVPDMVELLNGSMGTFTSGPLKDIKFMDLTEKIKSAGLLERLVPSRLTIWSSRGHIYALPHDVHPVMLSYRQDTVDKLGIDVSKLTTWAEFTRVGREITNGKNAKGADGGTNHYMIDLDAAGGDFSRVILLQAGGGFFDKDNHVVFDNDIARDVVTWYVRQTQNPGTGAPTRIATAAGWGQTLTQNILDERVLFIITPDWRTKALEMDVGQAEGKMRLMPLPEWTPGGIRTSTWGGTGMAFPKSCRNFDLAWKLAQKLYYKNTDLEKRFSRLNILPPVTDAWNLPEYDRARPYWGGQKLGRLYAGLAPNAPPEIFNAFTPQAVAKFGEALANTGTFYQTYGETRKLPDGTTETMDQYAATELKRCADYIRDRMARNVFLNDTATADAETPAVGGAAEGEAK